MTNDIKVIINGMGGVGCRMYRSILNKRGVSVVGAVDVDPAKIGADVGLVAGSEASGIIIGSSLEEVCSSTDADIVINLASSAEADTTFEQMLPAIRSGKNVMVANSATFDLFNGEEELAEKISAECIKYGVTYLGIGNTQSIERMIMMMAESTEDIKTLSFTHHADVAAFSASSNANQLGISLEKEEYLTRIKEGRAPALVKWREDLVKAIAARLEWKLDHIDYTRELKTDDNNIVIENKSKLRAYTYDDKLLAMDWVFLLDEKHEYYEKIVIDGTPATDAIIRFSPDRGKVATSNIMVKAIPYVVKAEPGYVSSFDIGIIMENYGG